MPFERNVAIDHEPIVRLVLEKFCSGEMSRNRCRQHQDQGFISIASEHAKTLNGVTWVLCEQLKIPV